MAIVIIRSQIIICANKKSVPSYFLFIFPPPKQYPRRAHDDKGDKPNRRPYQFAEHVTHPRVPLRRPRARSFSRVACNINRLVHGLAYWNIECIRYCKPQQRTWLNPRYAYLLPTCYVRIASFLHLAYFSCSRRRRLVGFRIDHWIVIGNRHFPPAWGRLDAAAGPF